MYVSSWAEIRLIITIDFFVGVSPFLLTAEGYDSQAILTILAVDEIGGMAELREEIELPRRPGETSNEIIRYKVHVQCASNFGR